MYTAEILRITHIAKPTRGTGEIQITADLRFGEFETPATITIACGSHTKAIETGYTVIRAIAPEIGGYKETVSSPQGVISKTTAIFDHPDKGGSPDVR
jgi:hypothetical protein